MFGPGGREASRARPRTVGVVACPAPWGVLWVSPQPLRVVIPCGRVTLSGRGCRFLGEGGALSVEATRGGRTRRRCGPYAWRLGGPTCP